MLKALLWYSGCQSGSFLESRYPPGRFIRYGIKYWISQKALDRMTYLARQGGTYVSDYALQSDADYVAMVNPDQRSKNLRSVFRRWKGLVVLKSECGKMNRSQVWWIRPVLLLCQVALQPLSSPVYGSDRLIVRQVSSTFRDKRREAELPNRETGLGAEPTPSRAGSKDFLWTKQPLWSIAKLIELAILPWKNAHQEIMIWGKLCDKGYF